MFHITGKVIDGTTDTKRMAGRDLVINLNSYVNQSVKTKHFIMEGIHILKDLLRAGDWVAKIDLKDAYFMVPMAEEDREYLRFQWKEKTYQFNCLPLVCHQPLGLYQDHTTSDSNIMGAWALHDHLQ